MSTLTYSDLTKLGRIVDAAEEGRNVAFLEDGERSDGTARSLGHGGFLSSTDDIREAELRITMSTGVERYELVSDLMERLGESFFLI
ncbi:hypothetical protein KHQ84_gp026 [Rhodococcus phage Finch]|uniref:Uncharacterized protein n=1 Tax=Rhodococcus phage Finch TaxID=2094144 RepID=A0A2P1JXA0_9CAUD|nr:hypothetical protein KHQ84_gp026 [Rhodococcus phage Finch]AVO24969.1 hypothetical protein SEA_FINCH_26 [Rhodococcus phage Finch]